jgi:hypothetical protein
MFLKVLGLLGSSKIQDAGFVRFGAAVVLVLAIGRAPALAVDHVYPIVAKVDRRCGGQAAISRAAL